MFEAIVNGKTGESDTIGVGDVNVVNAGPIGTADAVIEPVYKPKSIAFKSPTKLEALNIWIVLEAAFINQGDVLVPPEWIESASNSVDPVLKLPNKSVLNPLPESTL